MAVSTINSRTGFEAKTDSNEIVRIKVTGVDVKGQMFRHPATVLTLDGQACEFLSQSQPEQEGSVLVEFDYSKSEPKHCVSQARVKSIQAADSGLYRVSVRLEIAQTAKVTANAVESSSQSVEKKLPMPAVPATTVKSIAREDDSVTAPREMPFPMPSNAGPQPVPISNHEVGRTIKFENREPLTEETSPAALRETMKSAITEEIKAEIKHFRNSISGELEKMLPAVVKPFVIAEIEGKMDHLRSLISSDLEKALPGAVKCAVALEITDELTRLRGSISNDLENAVSTTVRSSLTAEINGQLNHLKDSISSDLENAVSARVRSSVIAGMKDEMNQFRGLISNEIENSLPATVRSAVAEEIKDQIVDLRSWISSELEKSLPAIVSSKIETTVHESVEKRVGAQYEASMQALNDGITRQVTDRIAKSQELRGVLEGMARGIFDEQKEISRTTVIELEKDLTVRAAAITRSFEEPIAGMEAKMKESRAELESALSVSHAVMQEISEGALSIHQVLEQLNKAQTAALESFQTQTGIQLRTDLERLETHLQMITADRAVQFSTELEKQLASRQQNAEETLDKLGAMLQLLQGMVRSGEQRLTEHSQSTAAGFEKEIRAVLLKLAGGAAHENT